MPTWELIAHTGVFRLAVLILTVDWNLRALWAVISLSAKLYLLCLFAMAGYTVFQLAKMIRSQRFLRRQSSLQVAAPLQQAITAKIVDLRQLQFLFLLIFGDCFANECFATIRAIRYSAVSLSPATIDIFEPATAFAFVVFALLSLLHGLQWFVSSRLERTKLSAAA